MCLRYPTRETHRQSANYFGWDGLWSLPWLAGMVILLLFEFIEGNTITRLYFMRLRRETQKATRHGHFTKTLENMRTESVRRWR